MSISPAKGFVLVSLFSLCTGFALAQAITGGMFGSVADSSGGPLPQVEIRLVNTATGAERILKTDHNGEFVIDSLESGEYSLTVKTSGFKTLERTGIQLSPSERLALGPIKLEVGSVDQRITVVAEGATVQTASSERASFISADQTEELPVYGRTVTSLVAISPGVVDTVGASARSLGGTNATNFNIAGNRSTTNNFSVDGVTMSALGGAANGTFMPAMESIAEVRVLTSNYQAEYGRLSGSDVQMVTKSGSLTYHGMAMYFGRNEALNANNFFNNSQGIRRPVNRFNAITYNIGGPVWFPKRFSELHNKVFFFFNQEFLPKSVSSDPANITMPTAVERTGNFSQTLSAGKVVSITDPNTGSPFPGSIIPPSRLDANGQALLKIFPLPNYSGSTAYNYVTVATTNEPVQLATLKLDFNPRPSDVFSITLLGNYETDTGPANDAAVTGLTVKFPLINGLVTKTDGELATGHYTHVFSPTTINQFVYGYALDFGPSDSFQQGSLAGLQRNTYGFNAGQLAPSSNPLNLLPGVSFAGVTNPPNITYDGRFPYDLTRYAIDFDDNLTHIVGSHTLKAGFLYEHLRTYNGANATNFNGLFNFGTNANNPLNTGNPYSNALLGVFNSYTEATSRPDQASYSNGLDTFVEDTWRVTRKLTLDYGVRISWYDPFFIKNNQESTFVPSLYNPSQAVQLIRPALVGGKSVGINPVTGQVYSSVLVGFIAPGTGNPTNGIVVAANTPGYPRALVNRFGPLFGPRFGFAYDPFGDGKTAIRGGFGIFHNRPLDNFGGTGAYPVVQTPVIEFGTLSNFTSAQGFISPPSVIAFQKNMKAQTVMNMSLTVQRNIGWGTVLDVAYVGSLGRHLSWAQDLEPVPLGAQFLPSNANPVAPSTPLPNAFLVPIQGYSSISYKADDGTSNYHSLQVVANRRFAHGIKFGLAYTWSKALDWADADFGAVNNAVPANLFRAWNYGLAGFDRTNIVKVNWIWDIPKWRTAMPPVRAVVNNWRLSGIATFQSGAPTQVGYTQTVATSITGTPSINARINVNGDPYNVGTGYGPLQAINPTVFSLPAVGTLGNPSKTLIRGPGIRNFDLTLTREVPLREKVKLQLRVEIYNALNHTQFSALNVTAQFNGTGAQTNSQFGQYTVARDPRIMQWAVRLQF